MKGVQRERKKEMSKSKEKGKEKGEKQKMTLGKKKSTLRTMAEPIEFACP